MKTTERLTCSYTEEERGDGKYLYVRKRVAGKQTLTYVGAYTEELYNLLLRNVREAREISLM